MAHPVLGDIGTAVARVADAILAGELGPTKTSQLEDEANRKAEALADALAQFQYEASVQVARIEKKINQLRWIFNVPVEILLAIIHWAVDFAPGPNRRLRALCTVTATWWRAIDSDPTLWSSISPGDLPGLAIQKSGKVPLTINWPEEITSEYNEGKPLSQPFAESIVPQIERWRALRLGDPAAINSFRPLLQQCVLTLEEVQLTANKYGRVSEAVELTGGPRLQKIAVSRVALRWECAALRGLHYLSIQDIPAGPSLSQIAHILSACTAIKTLRLESIYPTSYALLPPDFRPIHLQHLNRLTVSDCYWMSELLYRLRADSLMEAEIREKEDHYPHSGNPQVRKFAWMTHPHGGSHDLLRRTARNGGVTRLSCHIMGDFLCVLGKRGLEVPMKLTVVMNELPWPPIFSTALPLPLVYNKRHTPSSSPFQPVQN